jgi:hypothetical protein
MKVDWKGNVFATGPGGVLIYSPDGTLLGRILTGVPTANVAFGEDGATLFIAANSPCTAPGDPDPRRAAAGREIRFSNEAGFQERISHVHADGRSDSSPLLLPSCWPPCWSRLLLRKDKPHCWCTRAAPVTATKSILRRSRVDQVARRKSGYVIDTSEDPTVFTAENLAKYRRWCW